MINEVFLINSYLDPSYQAVNLHQRIGSMTITKTGMNYLSIINRQSENRFFARFSDNL